MIFMTPYPPQYIEGVEFRSMGQQGILGRYPMHFHILGSVGSTVCRGNSIINSNQRCVVLHASHNITVEGNVAFNNSGHCFITEEGGEMDNVFKNNLAILTSSVSIRISSEESDHQASGFWMSNPSNVLIGNVAAGSQDTGSDNSFLSLSLLCSYWMMISITRSPILGFGLSYALQCGETPSKFHPSRTFSQST